MRNLCEGFFLVTDLSVDSFRADAEQGIVDFLEHLSHGPLAIPAVFQNLVGQELHRTIVTSLWSFPKVRVKIAEYPGVADGFIQRTLGSTRFFFSVFGKQELEKVTIRWCPTREHMRLRAEGGE